MTPYEVSVAPDLIGKLDNVLQSFEISPVLQVNAYSFYGLVNFIEQNTMCLHSCAWILQFNDQSEELTSLVLQPTSVEIDRDLARPSRAGVVSWSPPQMNWNPWLGANIDEGPLATVRYSDA